VTVCLSKPAIVATSEWCKPNAIAAFGAEKRRQVSTSTVFCDNKVVMARQSVLSGKKRGPPATGKGTLIGVRLQPPDLSALDEWVAAQKDKPSRPEAIRRLVGQVLRKKR
jgi:hypothetical protein